MIRCFLHIGLLLIAPTTLLMACGDASNASQQLNASSAQARTTNDNTTGLVRFGVAANNAITQMSTTLVVPAEPPPSGTLFLWPGLQPGGSDFAPIGNGVLQPVLTWGPSCAPGSLGSAHSTWWISAEYVNLGSDQGYSGCQGGDRMPVNPNDNLIITMDLNDTTWTQTVATAHGSVSFAKDLQGQSQNFAYFVIEEDGQKPVSDVLFQNTNITFANPEPGACHPQQVDGNDFVAAPQVNAAGTQCTIDRLILRAQGVAPTLAN